MRATIDEAVVRTLICHPWERALGRNGAREILGVSKDSELLDHCKALYRLVGEGSITPRAWSALAARSPALARDELRATLEGLAASIGLRIRLILDLSPSPAGRLKLGPSGEHLAAEYLRVVSTAIPIVDRISSSLAAPTDLCAVIPDSVPLEVLGERISQAYQVRFAPYRSADFFSMLASGVVDGPDQARSDELAAVLDSRLARLDPQTALTTAMWLLDLAIDNQASAVSYKLSPQTWTESDFDDLVYRVVSGDAGRRAVSELRASPEQLEAVLRILVAMLQRHPSNNEEWR